MKRGSMGQMVACALGGLFLGALFGQLTGIGQIPGVAVGLVGGIMMDVYLTFFHR
ncbi:MAG: hypothetical protein Q4E13_12395 [Clostridia bacterium]|nr:hypothetical protein [Clostridia bacterium]